jgi:hypothetical protein
VVEGQSEEAFVNRILAPHLSGIDVWTTSTIVSTSRAPAGKKHKGGGHWKQWLKDIHNLCRDQGRDFRVTTMFDLYGLPRDFPRLRELAVLQDTSARADALEIAMREVIDDLRFDPNVLRHEFETLVLAAWEQLGSLLDAEDQRKGLDRLRKEVSDTKPEDVDDGHTSAPSKRLRRAIPGYGKLIHGLPALQVMGLAPLRAACPRFDAWVRRIEGLGRRRG